MTSPNDDLVDQALGLVQRMADVVLSKPPEEREAEYEVVRDIGYSAGVRSEMSEAESRFAGEMIQFLTRECVRIRQGGVPYGGHA